MFLSSQNDVRSVIKWLAGGLPLVLYCLLMQPTYAQQKEQERKQVQTRCYEILTNAMRTDSFWPAMHAAEGLTLAGKSETVIALLEPRVSSESDDQRRCGLARELARAGREAHVATLVSILKDTKSTGRVHAAESLFKLGKVGDQAALQLAYEKTDIMPLKLMSAAALIRAQPDQHQAHLAWVREQLKSSEQSTRYLVAFLLSYLGDHSDKARLQLALDGETDENNQAILTAALAVQGDKQSVGRLQELLVHTSPTVRTIAAEYLGTSGSVDSLAGLEKLLDDKHLDASVRAATACLLLSGATAKGNLR